MTDALTIVGGLAFVIWIATTAILNAMKKAAAQRNALYQQLDRIAQKIDGLPDRLPGSPARDAWEDDLIARHPDRPSGL